MSRACILIIATCRVKAADINIVGLCVYCWSLQPSVEEWMHTSFNSLSFILMWSKIVFGACQYKALARITDQSGFPLVHAT